MTQITPDDAATGSRDLVEMYRHMALVVACDEALRAALSAGRIQLAYYSPRGQEAVSAGWSAALRPDDQLVTTYRGLHDQLAKGVPLEPLLAEMLGRATGTSGGKGGPMHVDWPEVGLALSTGIVGAGLPIACGLAWAQSRRGDAVTVVCFGDGATNIGAFHEALNLAALWRLPVVFVCQNNGYGEHTAVAGHQRVAHVAERAVAYAMPGVTVDGNDPVAVAEAVGRAAAGARSGKGPSLVEAVCYRLYGHAFGDPMTYVPADELAAAWQAEPTTRLRHRLVTDGVATDASLDAVESDCRTLVEAALDSAVAAPEPDPADLLTGVTAPRRPFRPDVAATDVDAGESVSVRVALNRALRDAMADDDRVVVLGEDVGETGGVFGVTKGLQETFGDRVRDTPISEQAIVGAAIGAAIGGLRPVAEVMFMDFLALGLDQLVNHAAKIRYMSGGRAAVPLVIRTAVGAGLGVGAQHSQMLEAWLLHAPGIKVAVPSNAADAYGLLRACIDDDDPCVIVEQVPLLARKGPLGPPLGPLPLGAASTVRTGSDVTVVSWGRQVHDAVGAAETLAGEGIDVEVIDLRTLAPLDEDTLVESVSRTRRVVVVHEAVTTGGFGAEICARLTSACFDTLLAAPVRVGAVDAPLPYARNLEGLALPSPERICEAVRAAMGAKR